MIDTVIKRNGDEVPFDIKKIKSAVARAAYEIFNKDEPLEITEKDFINNLTFKVSRSVFNDINYQTDKNKIAVEDIQDAVENSLMEYQEYDIAKAYIRYRYDHELARQRHNDEQVFEIISNDEHGYWATENSNKDSNLVTVQRDYLAGSVSTDIARNYIFSKDVVEAHDKGWVHQHDMDYMAQATLHNCELVNLEDMLQNGTVINKVRINKPHRLSTAMNVATQIMASVAANSYGGESITLTHLAPFVRDSYNIFLKKYRDAGLDEEQVQKLAKIDLDKEISNAVQTFNYQLSTLFTLNGQAPFCSVFMYLNETEEYKEELILLIKEILKQRMKGMPNREGVPVTQAFPKLLMVLQEDNYKPGTKYWDVTKLAIECSSHRLTPDYISEKVMKELKEGQCFPCMGKCKL